MFDDEKSYLLLFAGMAMMAGLLMLFDGMVWTGVFTLAWAALALLMSTFY